MSLLRRSTAAGDYTNLLRRSVGGAVFPNSNERVGTSEAPPPARSGLLDAFAELAYYDGINYASSVWTGGPGWDLNRSLYHGGSGASRLNTVNSYYHCTFTFRVAGTSTDAPLTVGLYRDDSNGYIATFGTGIVQGLNGLVFLQGTIFDGTTTSTFTYSNGDLFNLTLVKNVLTFTQNGAPVLAPTTVSGVYRFFGSILTTQGTGQSVSSWSFELVPIRWWGLRGGDADITNWSLSKVYARHSGTATNFAYWLSPYIASTSTFSVTKSGSSPLYVGITSVIDVIPESDQTTYIFTFGSSTFTIQSGETTILGATSYISTDVFVVEYNTDGVGAVTFKKNGSSIATYTYGGDLMEQYFYLQSSAADQLNNFSYVEYAAPPPPPPATSAWVSVEGDLTIWNFTNSSRNVEYIGSNLDGNGVTSLSFFPTPTASLTLSGLGTSLSFYRVGATTDASALSGQGTTVYLDISRDSPTTSLVLRRRRRSMGTVDIDSRITTQSISSVQWIVDPCYNAYFQATDSTGGRITLSAADATTGGSMTDVCYSVFASTNIPNGQFIEVSRANRPSAWYAISEYPVTYFNLTRLDSNRVAGAGFGAVLSLSASSQAYAEYTLHSVSSNAIAVCGFGTHIFYLSGTGPSTANAMFIADTLPALQSDPFGVSAGARFFVQASGGFIFARALASNGTQLYTTLYGYFDACAGRLNHVGVSSLEEGRFDLSSIQFNTDPSMVPGVLSNAYWQSPYLLAWDIVGSNSLTRIVDVTVGPVISVSKFVTPTLTVSFDGAYSDGSKFLEIGFTTSTNVNATVKYYITLSYDSGTTGIQTFSGNVLVQSSNVTASISGLQFIINPTSYTASIALIQNNGTEVPFIFSNLPSTVSYYIYSKTNLAGLALTNISRGETPTPLPPPASWAAITDTTSIENWATTATSLSYFANYGESAPAVYSTTSYQPKSYLSVSINMGSNSDFPSFGLVSDTTSNAGKSGTYYFFKPSYAGDYTVLNVCGEFYSLSLYSAGTNSYELQISGSLFQAKYTSSLGAVWDFSLAITDVTTPMHAYGATRSPNYASFPSISFTSNPVLPPPAPPLVEAWTSLSGPLSNWSPRTAKSLLYNGTDSNVLLKSLSGPYTTPYMTMSYSLPTSAAYSIITGFTKGDDPTAGSDSVYLTVNYNNKLAPNTVFTLDACINLTVMPTQSNGLTDIAWDGATTYLQLSDNIVYARLVSPRGPWWDLSYSNASFNVADLSFRQFVLVDSTGAVTNTNLSLTFTNVPLIDPTAKGPQWVQFYNGGSSLGSLADWTLSGVTDVSHADLANLGIIESLSKFATPYSAFVLDLLNTTESNSLLRVGLGDTRDGGGMSFAATFYSKDTNNYLLEEGINGVTIDPPLSVSRGSVIDLQWDSNSNATFRIRTQGTQVYSNTMPYTLFTNPDKLLVLTASGAATLTNISWTDTPQIPVVLSTDWSAVAGTTDMINWAATPTSLSYNASNAESTPAVYSTISYATPYVTASLVWTGGDGPARIGLVKNPSLPDSFGYWFKILESGPASVFFSVCGTLIDTELFGEGTMSYQVQSDGTNVQARVDAQNEFWVYTVSQSGVGKMHGYVRTDKIGSGTYAYVPSISVNDTPVLPQYGLDSNGWGASDYWTVASNSLSTSTIGHLRTVGTDTITSTVSYDYAVFSLAPESGQTFISFGDTAAMGLVANRTSPPEVQLYYKGSPDNQIWYDYIGGPPGGAAIGVASENAVSLTLSVDSASCNATITVVTSPNGFSFTSNSTTVSLTAPKYHGWIQSGMSNTIGRFSLARVGPNISYGWADVGDPATWYLAPATTGPPGLYDIGHLSSTPETIITILSYLPSRLQVTPTSATTALTSLSYGLATTRTPGTSDYWLWFSNTGGDVFDALLYNGITGSDMMVASGISNIDIADTMLRVSSNPGTGSYELIADVGINGPAASNFTLPLVAAVPYYAFITSAFSNDSLPVATNVRFSNA